MQTRGEVNFFERVVEREFLDNEVVKVAVNMPYRYKIRFSPTVLEKAHPGIRDKWVVRKVADRYIPRELSQRIKIGFRTS